MTNSIIKNQISNIPPLVVVVGPTASGKSAVAMRLAKKLRGEIICADSRTVYSGMDIGTAKPTRTERNEVPHHLLDVVMPDQVFTAAEFKRQANAAISDIAARGRLPIMVGGTGLYVDGVIFDFAFLPPVAPDERDALEALSLEQLQAKILERKIPMPENMNNKRHLVRALETNGAIAVKKGIRANTLVLGLDITKEEVTKRIRQRVSAMAKAGLKQEVEKLVKLYGWEAPGLTAVGYREWRQCLEGNQTVAETLQQIENSTIQYAKRQRTWFKRNPHINWIQNSDAALDLVKEFLQ